MISIIGIIGVIPIIVVFGICFALTLRSYLNNPNRTKILFMVWSLAVVATYFSWGLRVIFIDRLEATIDIIYPFFAVSYAMGGTALIFLDFATINQSPQKDSKLMKVAILLIIISYIMVIVILINGFAVELVLFMDVIDLKIINPIVYFFFSGLILLFIFFPNAIFINYLLKAPDKTTFAYKRVRIIELGIILFSIGIALDGMRLPLDMGIFVVRIILMVGGLITLRGFLMKPSSEKSE